MSLRQDIDTYLKDFFALTPTVYHICDGRLSSIKDLHLYLGTGDYQLKHLITDFTDENAYITMETGDGTEKHCDTRVVSDHKALGLTKKSSFDGEFFL